MGIVVEYSIAADLVGKYTSVQNMLLLAEVQQLENAYY